MDSLPGPFSVCINRGWLYSILHHIPKFIKDLRSPVNTKFKTTSDVFQLSYCSKPLHDLYMIWRNNQNSFYVWIVDWRYMMWLNFYFGLKFLNQLYLYFPLSQIMIMIWNKKKLKLNWFEIFKCSLKGCENEAGSLKFDSIIGQYEMKCTPHDITSDFGNLRNQRVCDKHYGSLSPRGLLKITQLCPGQRKQHHPIVTCSQGNNKVCLASYVPCKKHNITT